MHQRTIITTLGILGVTLGCASIVAGCLWLDRGLLWPGLPAVLVGALVGLLGAEAYRRNRGGTSSCEPS